MKWLWLLLALFVWPIIFQVTASVVPLFVPFNFGPAGVAIFDGLAVTAVAFFLARILLSRGAPQSLWIAVAVASLPFALLVVSTSTINFGDSSASLLQRSAMVVGAILTAMGPAAAVFAAGRRGITATVEDRDI